MTFYRKELINISGISRATFYRRLSALRRPGEKKNGNYLSEEQALNIAKQLQFTNLFYEYLNQKKQHEKTGKNQISN